MSLGDNRTRTDDQPLLGLFELPKPTVKLAVQSCRLFNTALDALSYDVATLASGLADADRTARAVGAAPPSCIVSFDALRDPAGSLLLIDPRTEPFVREFPDVELYLGSPLPVAREVAVAWVPGVGCSTLGSAELAWDVAVALKEPVLAIVPGYGVADVPLQALEG